MSPEQIARVCHEANRAYALGTGEDPARVHAGWAECPEEIRQSAITGVKKALEGYGPVDLHNSWMVSKQNAGWKYGPVRDNENKIHPCMVAYADLPDTQQKKDALFLAIVQALR